MTKQEKIQQFVKEFEEITGEEISYEEAEQQLLESGELQEETGTGSGWPFAMKKATILKDEVDVQELKLVSLFGTSRYLAYNMAVKKDKQAEKFIEGEFYLSPSVVKDEEGKIDPSKCSMGVSLGDEINIVILGQAFYRERYIDKKIRDSEKKKGIDLPHDVATCFADNSFQAGQEAMIDKNSGKNAWEIRQDQLDEYGKLENVPKEQKVKTKQYIYGVVETEDGWKPFWYNMKVNLSENSLTKVIQDVVKDGGMKKTIIKITSEHNGTMFIQSASVEGQVGNDDYKDVIFPAAIGMGAEFKEIKLSQKKYLDNKFSGETKSQSTEKEKESDSDEPDWEDD